MARQKAFATEAEPGEVKAAAGGATDKLLFVLAGPELYFRSGVVWLRSR